MSVSHNLVHGERGLLEFAYSLHLRFAFETKESSVHIGGYIFQSGKCYHIYKWSLPSLSEYLIFLSVVSLQ